jgi:hypothetical protein
MKTIKDVADFLETTILECDPKDGRCGRCDDVRKAIEILRLKCTIPVVSERLFICERCKTEYRTESTEKKIGCCINQAPYRTSGICGGELVEQV